MSENRLGEDKGLREKLFLSKEHKDALDHFAITQLLFCEQFASKHLVSRRGQPI